MGSTKRPFPVMVRAETYLTGPRVCGSCVCPWPTCLYNLAGMYVTNVYRVRVVVSLGVTNMLFVVLKKTIFYNVYVVHVNCGYVPSQTFWILGFGFSMIRRKIICLFFTGFKRFLNILTENYFSKTLTVLWLVSSSLTIRHSTYVNSILREISIVRNPVKRI